MHYKKAIMDIQIQKSLIIEQFKQVNDINLLNAIQSMLEYALTKKEKDLVISKAHQDLVIDRYQDAVNNPDTLLDWDDAKNMLKTE